VEGKKEGMWREKEDMTESPGRKVRRTKIRRKDVIQKKKDGSGGQELGVTRSDIGGHDLEPRYNRQWGANVKKEGEPWWDPCRGQQTRK